MSMPMILFPVSQRHFAELPQVLQRLDVAVVGIAQSLVCYVQFLLFLIFVNQLTWMTWGKEKGIEGCWAVSRWGIGPIGLGAPIVEVELGSRIRVRLAFQHSRVLVNFALSAPSTPAPVWTAQSCAGAK